MHRIIVLFILTTVSTYAFAQSETNDSTFMSPGQQEEVVIEDPTLDSVYEFLAVEQQPEFPNGTAALFLWLDQNTKYPVIARQNDIEGKVVLTFILEKDGSISNIKAIRELGGGCTEEAIRVVKMMPKWKPGMQNGQLVRVKYNLPFTLLVDSEKKVIHLYGANGMFSTKRISYLIDPTGIIKKIYNKVIPETHADEVLADLKNLTIQK